MVNNLTKCQKRNLDNNRLVEAMDKTTLNTPERRSLDKVIIEITQPIIDNVVSSLNNNQNLSLMKVYREKIRPVLFSHTELKLIQKRTIIFSIFEKMLGIFKRLDRSLLGECVLVEKLGLLDLLIQTGKESEAFLIIQKTEISLINYISRVINNYQDSDKPLLKFLLLKADHSDLKEAFIYAIRYGSGAINLILEKIADSRHLVKWLFTGEIFDNPQMQELGKMKLEKVPNPDEWKEILRNSGVDVSVLERNWLFRAVKSVDLEMLCLLLEKGVSVNVISNGDSPLYCAVKLCDLGEQSDPLKILTMIELLISHHANVDFGNQKFFELILYYLNQNKDDIQKKQFLLIILKKLFNDANIVDYIIANEIEDDLSFLLEHGVNVNQCSSDDTVNLLSWALDKQNYGLAQLLRKLKADPNFQEGVLIKKAIEQLDEYSFKLLVKDNQNIRIEQLSLLAFVTEQLPSLNQPSQNKLKKMITEWLNANSDPTVTDHDRQNWNHCCLPPKQKMAISNIVN